MKRWLKIVCGVALSCMCIFACLGYAQFSDDMTVEGSVSVTAQEGVYITNVTQSGTNGSVATVNGFTMTVLNSKTTLGSNGKATLIYTITVYNNTNIDYGYNAMIYTVGANTFDNENIVVAPQIERRTVVESKGSLTFDVIVSYKDGKQAQSSELNSIITYEFLPLEDIPEDEDEIAVSGVLEQFRKILNNEVVGIPNSYNELLTQMDDYRNNDRYNASYIGNVDGASYEDVAILGELFQGQLSLNINGSDTPVTVMIKNEEIDGNTANGNEMTIYMTTHDLQKQSSGWFAPTEYANVYAAVFRKDTLETGGTAWRQVGDLYLGSAEIKQYSGRPGNGSFDTDNWRLLNDAGNRTSTTIKNIIQSLE